MQDARCGSQPLEGATEPDDADAVTGAQMGLGQGRGGADRERQRLLACAGGELGERVEEQHDVGAALGVAVGDVRGPGARRGTPVHAAQLVAGHIGSELGELEPVASHRRSAGADGGLGPRGRNERAQPLDAGQDAHGRVRVDRAGIPDAAQRPAGPDTGGAGPIAAPALGLERHLHAALFAGREMDDARGRRASARRPGGASTRSSSHGAPLLADSS